MKTSFLLTHSLSATACLLLLGSTLPGHAEPANVIVNSDFEAAPPPQGGIPDWLVLGDQTKASVVSEDGNQFLRLNLPGQNYLQVRQILPVRKSWTGLEISGKARVTNLVKGPEGYNTATLLYYFEDAKGEHVGDWSQHMFFADQDWEPFHNTLEKIPEGAKTLFVACSLMNASGTVDFDDVVVTPITASGEAASGSASAPASSPEKAK